jgi:hypothetical protein
MIRRNIDLDHGIPAWLLISQVEHARISGELARAWSEPFPEEVLAAIAHHDDGWAAWEAAPRIDPQRGCPYSFLEMPIAEALTIWDDSIAAARRIGALSGWIVAGHFLSLASGSEQATSSLAQSWLREMTNKRAAWLAEWQKSDASHTLALAERGQQLLLTVDLLSLWLCCDGPVSVDDPGSIANSEMNTRNATVLGKYRFTPKNKSVRNDEIVWQGSIDPWPLAVPELTVAAPATAAAVARYDSWLALAAASEAVGLRWLLTRSAAGMT